MPEIHSRPLKTIEVTIVAALLISVAGITSAFAQESTSQYRIGTCDWSIKMPVSEESFRFAKLNGLDGIQYSFDAEGKGLDLRTRENRDKVRAIVKETGVGISSLGIGLLNRVPLATTNEADQLVLDCLDTMVKLKQEAAELADHDLAAKVSPKIVLLAFFGKADLNGSEDRMNTVIGKLKRFAPIAEKHGFILGIESLLSEADHRRILEGVQSPSVKVYYDTANSARMGYDIYREIASLGVENICEVHIKQDAALLGNGNIDFEKVKSLLDKMNYAGWLIIEGSTPKGMSRTEATAANAVFSRTLFNPDATVSSSPAFSKPNVLLFLVDDMGLMDTSVPFLSDDAGNADPYPLNRFYRTPNMERLAALGTRYSQFYANSVCSPTRATLMNGQFSARHHTTQFIRPENKNTGDFGPVAWKWEGFGEGDPALPAQLKSAGYRTIHSGKAHFGPIGHRAENPLNIGFDVNIAGCSFGQPGSYLGQKNYGHGIAKREKRAVPGLEKYHGTETHLSEAITIEMKAAITESVSAKKPFFAYMSHYAVHSPFEADPRFVENYREAGSPRHAAFASLIEGMDKSLGDLLDHLERLGVAENTFVIFLGDNGTDAPIGGAHEISCAAPLRGKKGTHYEGGMRVPMIAAWAKRSANSDLQVRFPVVPDRLVVDGFGQICDVYATIMKLTDTKSVEGHQIDGISLLPSLAGQQLPRERSFLMHFPHSHRSSYFTAFRKGRYKLVYHYPVGGSFEANQSAAQIELFDLTSDADESDNLANTNPGLTHDMLGAMKEALVDSGAQYPVLDGQPLKPDPHADENAIPTTQPGR